MSTESDSVIGGDISESVSETHFGGKYLKKGLTATTVGFWLVVLFYATTQAVPRIVYGVFFIGALTIIYILSELTELDKGEDRRQIASLLLLGGGVIVATLYIMYNWEPLIYQRVGYNYDYEYVIGMAIVIGVSYFTYREYGLSFFLVLFGSILYGYFGRSFSGVFAHSGLSVPRLIELLVLDFRGFYGSITQIVAAWVSLFLLYAGLLRSYGAFDIIIRIAFRAATYIRSGVAQSAVIASMIIGSINGSAAANAAMTGAFTIPLMKTSGIKSETAAGIESVASSGGQIMPPVMGAAAFVMASLLGIRYIDVVVAGLVPAFIFFVSVTIAVHYSAIGQITDETLDVENHVDATKTRNEILVDSAKFLLPLFVLIYLLGVVQWTVMTSALVTVIAMVVAGIGFPLVQAAADQTEGTVYEAAKDELRSTVGGFRYGAMILAPLGIIVAAINGIVDLLSTTGVPGALSLAVLDIAGGVMIFSVLLAMAICILLGLGMPTVAAYTLVAILIAPTLVENFFLPELAVHYFVFYAAILSGLTPPIAVAVVVASGVAESNFWRSCYDALRIAAPLYVLPVAMIYNPDIIVGGLTARSLLLILLTLGGAGFIAYGLNYGREAFGFSNPIGSSLRLVYVIAGTLAMTWPDVSLKAALLVFAGLFAVLQSDRIPGLEAIRT